MGNIKENFFEDGHFKVEIEETVRGKDMFMITDIGNYLYVPVHEIPDMKWKDLGKHISNIIKINSEENIIDAIKFGEKIFNRGVKNISPEIRDLYNIMLVISKSISINLLDLESFEKYNDLAFETILNIYSKINLEEKNIEALKTEIYKAAETDLELMRLIRNSQEERYGMQGKEEVSYTTIPNKAVLVVGSNIRELETVLEALKNENIDIYTHDDMMLAHTFPNFKMYPRLKGQYGQGIENCLLDFATFPGPIVLTKHSLHNIENFYRGRLFTTDYTTNPKGIIKIENKDE